MEADNESWGRRGRRRRPDSSVNNLAMKMPRCQVRVPIINVRTEQEKLRAPEEARNRRKRIRDQAVNELSIRKHTTESNDHDAVEFGVQLGSGSGETVRFDLMEELPNEVQYSKRDKCGKKRRMTRQGLKHSGEVNLENKQTPNSSSMVSIPSLLGKGDLREEAEVHLSNVKYKSVKTGKLFEKHPCNLCMKVFSSSVGLKFHESSHMLQCSVCQKKFVDRKQLEAHTEEHITSMDTTQQLLKCSSCGKEFSSQKLLKIHSETKNIHSRPFSCSLETCERTFTKRAHLNNHRLVHPDLREIECEKCAMKFSSNQSLENHQGLPNCGKISEIPISNSRKTFECPECRKYFSKNEYLEMHQSYHWEAHTPAYPCWVSTCKLTFSTKNKLEKHMEKHTTIIRDGKFLCTKSNCQDRFKDPSLLKKHQENHSTTEICKNCGLSFITKMDMLVHKVVCRHEKTHNQNLSCSLCSKVFKFKRFLDNHMKVCGNGEFKSTVERLHGSELAGIRKGDNTQVERYSGGVMREASDKASILELFNDAQFYDVVSAVGVGEPFTCKHSNCDGIFSRRSELREHYMNHHPRDSHCTECDQNFNDRTELAKHRVTAHAQSCPPIICPFCKDKFLSRMYLQNHLLSVHPAPWICAHAGCTFSPSCLLEASIHMQNHRVRKCDWPLCGKTFQSRRDLMEHIQIHTETLLSCPVQTCTFICCMTERFQKHMEQQHMYERLFSCHPCSYHSYNMRQLECHLESGHRERPKPHEFTREVNVTCQVKGCTASFVQEDWLLKHMRSVHREVEEQLPIPIVIVDNNKNVASSQLPTNTDSVELIRQVPPCEENQHSNYSEDNKIKNPSMGSSTFENSKKACGLITSVNVEEHTESLPQSSPLVDNSLLDSFIQGSFPGPPIATSLRKSEQEVNDSATQASVVIIEISEEGSDSHDMVPPVTNGDYAARVDEENNLHPEVLFNEEDVIIEEVVEANVESDTDNNSLYNVKCYDSQVVFRTEVVEENNAKLVEHGNTTDENSNLEPATEIDSLQTNPEMRKATLSRLYSSVVSGSACPVPGEFVRVLNITDDMMGALVIPDMLQPVDTSSTLCRGLAIDLLDLQHRSKISPEELANFVSKLLPVSERPTLPNSNLVDHMVTMLTKMKVQSSRFRARYSSFPSYLDKYLVELCNPFS